MQRTVENEGRTYDTADMEHPLESMARTLVARGQYRISSRLEPPLSRLECRRVRST